MSRSTLYLLDGFALAYRAYYAFIRQPRMTASGQNVSAVYGVTTAILDLLDKHKPDHLGFVLDCGKTFRHELYPPYKANRVEMPAEMREQLDLMNQIVRAMGVPILMHEGYEADDVMGTLAQLGEESGLDVYLVTGDKDLFQLVTPHVRVILPPRSGAPETILDAAAVEAKFGVRPERVTDVLALAGDSSDNIPGVPGIGPKTAIKLVREYGALESILAAAPTIRGKLGERLREHADLALLSNQLVQIKRDVPIALDLGALKIGDRDEAQLRPLVLSLDSQNLLRRLGLGGDQLAIECVIVSNRSTLDDLCRRIVSAGHVTVDTETTGLDPLRAELVGIALSIDGERGFYIPIAHTDGATLDLALVQSVLGPLLASPEIGKNGQNIKYDMHILERSGLPLQGVNSDTMVASYLLDSSSRQHNLEALAMRHLGHSMIPISQLIGKKRQEQQLTMDQVEVERAAEYAAEDAVVTQRLADLFLPRLAEQGLKELFDNVEVPLITVLQRMEARGVALDTAHLMRLSVEMQQRSSELEARIHEEAGEVFNVNSPKQLQKILFTRLGLKPVRKTKTGYSTDARVLEALANEHPVPRLILQNRELVKLRTTYVDALPRMVNPQSGRLHTQFHQTVAATGRLSSSDPNLQNIPIRTEEGRRIRAAFVSRGPGWKLLSADYSQIELRILAHLSGDEGLRRAFASGVDIHRATAAKIFGIDDDAVDSDTRRRAKAINFGIIYGMGAYGLSSRLGISMEEARAFIETYFEAFPRIREFIENTLETTRERGYVTTVLNRRRYFPEIQDSNRQVREFAERAAVNTAIQGSAADLIKVAMIRIEQRLNDAGLDSVMILQVHDELLFDARIEEMERLRAVVVEEMEGALTTEVPLVVDVGSGDNWLEAHE